MANMAAWRANRELVGMTMPQQKTAFDAIAKQVKKQVKKLREFLEKYDRLDGASWLNNDPTLVAELQSLTALAGYSNVASAAKRRAVAAPGTAAGAGQAAVLLGATNAKQLPSVDDLLSLQLAGDAMQQQLAVEEMAVEEMAVEGRANGQAVRALQQVAANGQRQQGLGVQTEPKRSLDPCIVGPTAAADPCGCIGLAGLLGWACTETGGRLRSWPGVVVVPADVDATLVTCKSCGEHARRAWERVEQPAAAGSEASASSEAKGGPQRTNVDKPGRQGGSRQCVLCSRWLPKRSVKCVIANQGPGLRQIFNITADAKCCSTCSRNIPRLKQKWTQAAGVAAAAAAADYHFVGYEGLDQLGLSFEALELTRLRQFGVQDLTAMVAAVAAREYGVEHLTGAGVPPEVATILLRDVQQLGEEHRLRVNQTSLGAIELAELTTKGLMLRGVHMQHMHEAAVELGVKERSRQAGQVPGGSVEANKLREEWV